MDEADYRRKTKSLWALINIAALYCFIFVQRRVLTGHALINDAVSVMLGLFICSRIYKAKPRIVFNFRVRS